MKPLFNVVERLYNKKIEGKGLALFRIFFSLVFLGELIQLFFFRHLVFDKIPYIAPSEIQLWPIFFFWFIVIFLVIFGLFTRIAALINYILTVIFLGAITSFEYHMFYAYLTVNFLFIILPVSRSFSLDRLLKKLKYSNTRFHYNPPTKVSVLSYYVPLFLGIGLVYFDSVFWKFGSYLWTHGLGLWLPSSMPQAVLFDVSPLLNMKYLVIGLGYLTLIFETIFLFTFWRKRWRVIILAIGVGLHIGILICFPIPFFALGVIAIYLLLVPVSWWEKLFSVRKDTVKKLTIYYDAECPLCNRTKIVCEHLDVKKRLSFLTVQEYAKTDKALDKISIDNLLDNIHSVDRNGRVHVGVDTYIYILNAIWYLKPLALLVRIPGIYQISKKVYGWVAVNRIVKRCTEETCGYELPTLPVDEAKMKLTTKFTLKDLKIRAAFSGLLLLCIFQLIVTFNSLVIRQIEGELGVNNTFVIKAANFMSNEANQVTKVFLGLTHHAVFMDTHFDNYNHSVAVIYINKAGKEEWLPITDRNGTPGDYLFNFNWVNWTFRVMNSNVDNIRLVEGIRNYTAFWAYNNGVSLKNATFKIKVKKNRVPQEWEDDFLDKQLAHPWLDGGTVQWENNKFTAQVKTIENL